MRFDGKALLVIFIVVQIDLDFLIIPTRLDGLKNSMRIGISFEINSGLGFMWCFINATVSLGIDKINGRRCDITICWIMATEMPRLGPCWCFNNAINTNCED